MLRLSVILISVMALGCAQVPREVIRNAKGQSEGPDSISGTYAVDHVLPTTGLNISYRTEATPYDAVRLTVNDDQRLSVELLRAGQAVGEDVAGYRWEDGVWRREQSFGSIAFYWLTGHDSVMWKDREGDLQIVRRSWLFLAADAVNGVELERLD